MQVEVKQKLQEVINQNFELEQKGDIETKKFLSTYGLPQSLHAATSTTEIPPTLWEKIEDFQKKGGNSNLSGMITGINAIRDNNVNMIESMAKILDEEEGSDNQMRAQFQQRWSRMPSQGLTQNFRHQLQDFKTKAQIAGQADKKLEEKFAQQGEALKLLGRSKQELSSMIP